MISDALLVNGELLVIMLARAWMLKYPWIANEITVAFSTHNTLRLPETCMAPPEKLRGTLRNN